MITVNIAVTVLVIAAAVIFIVLQSVRLAFFRKRLGAAVVGTEKRNIQLTYLIKSAQTLSSALSKEKLLRLIIEIFGEITKSDRTAGLCALYLMDYNIGRFVYSTGFNMDVTMLSKPSFEITDHLFKELKKSGDILFFDEKAAVKSAFFKDNKLHMLEDVDRALAIPLALEGDIIGIIVSFLPQSSYDFLKRDVQLLRALTGQASIALGSAVQSELAVLDRLTKIYNHAYFEGRLAQEMARSDRYKYPVSVLMVDIDHFKDINDNYGHQAGDALLKEIAHVIKSNIRAVDLCARYGGEEFAVILPETNLTGESRRDESKNLEEAGGAVAKAEQLRKKIAASAICASSGKSLQVTASIGIGVKSFPENADMNKDDLIMQADRQLYRAKREGRNRVCYPAITQ